MPPPGSIAVFAPSPLLTITVERDAGGPAVHLHAGGQGFWVARLAAALGAQVTLCCALVGGVALTAGLDAGLTLVTGCRPADLVNADLYRRLVSDLRANDCRVLADLTGPPLHAVLKAGVDVLRLSEQELVWEGYSETDSFDDILAGARRLHEEGARHVVVTRAAAPAVWISDGADCREIGLTGPAFETLDASGTGDSMFAATAAGLARGMEMLEALRLGMAAGALNATRRGLGSGTREEIERLARHIDSFPLGARADARERRSHP